MQGQERPFLSLIIFLIICGIAGGIVYGIVYFTKKANNENLIKL